MLVGASSLRTRGSSRSLVEQLREALASRPVIEQAKVMIMLLRACLAEEASTGLREISQHTNVKLHDVAAVIVASGSGGGTSPDSELFSTVMAEIRRTVLGRSFAEPPTDSATIVSEPGGRRKLRPAAGAPKSLTRYTSSSSQPASTTTVGQASRLARPGRRRLRSAAPAAPRWFPQQPWWRAIDPTRWPTPRRSWLSVSGSLSPPAGLGG